jgi:hypothetical protein
MRAVLASPFCLVRHVSFVSSCRASWGFGQCLAYYRSLFRAAPLWQIRRQLGDRHALVAAGVDRGVGREVHVDIERDAVIAAAVLDAQAQRGDLGAADIDAGGARQALAVTP